MCILSTYGLTFKVARTSMYFCKVQIKILPPKYAITDERMRVRTVNESATSFQLQWKRQRFVNKNFSLKNKVYIGVRIILAKKSQKKDILRA